MVTNKNDPYKKDIYYLYQDYLGSLIAVAEQGQGITQQFNFDPWGRRRNPNNWNEFQKTSPSLFTRGFTGHEHIDAMGLINMNGRMYDPRLARFLSPDPFIQAPDFTQSYNRYSYVWNNPLKYTDPSGYMVHMEFAHNHTGGGAPSAGYMPPPWPGYQGADGFGGPVHWSVFAGKTSEYDHYQAVLYSGSGYYLPCFFFLGFKSSLALSIAKQQMLQYESFPFSNNW